MRKFVIFAAIVLFSSGGLSQSISITEIMFDPPGADYYDEYIELFNCGDSSISLNNFQLSISGNIDVVTCPGPDSVLNPGDFALILDRGYLIDSLSTTYDSIIPPGTPLFTITDNAFGSNGISNSSSEEINLLNPNGNVICSVVTTPNQEAGYSDEKILLCSPDTVTNWGNSSIFYGTPGFRNSISPLSNDLAVSHITPSVNNPGPSDTVLFSITVENIGINLANNFILELYEDSNFNAEPDSEEILEQFNVYGLLPGDSVILSSGGHVFAAGKHRICCTIQMTNDENMANNTIAMTLGVHYPENSVCFNEIMYKPSSGSDGEWIEIMNLSGDSIDLAGWSVSDLSSSTVIDIPEFKVPSDSLVVIANSLQALSQFPEATYVIILNGNLVGLNNSGDSLTLRDYSGFCIDKMRYYSSWGGGTNVSLEKRNPIYSSNSEINWGSCINANGGTPGFPNSIELPETDLEISSMSFDDSLCMPGDTINISFNLLNSGKLPVSGIKVSLKDNENDVYSVVVSDTIETLSSLYYTFSYSPFSSGYRNITLSALIEGDLNLQNNSRSGAIYVSYPAHCVIINEIMYLPETGQSEWIELYNLSDFPVNLRSLQLYDASSSGKTISNQDFWLEADSFCVIASSEDVLSAFNLPANKVLIPEDGFPTLNNDADSVRLFDPAGLCLDRQYYNSGMGKVPGTSLERIDPWYFSADSSNWKLSCDTDGATPGRKNCSVISDYELSVSFSSDSIFCSSNDSATTISFEVTNIGRYPLTRLIIDIYLDRNGNSLSEEDEIVSEKEYHNLILKPDSSFIDSLEINIPFYGFRTVFFHFQAESLDAEIEYSLNIFRCYPGHSVVINEIMYDPGEVECEWFEVYNPGSLTVSLQGWKFSDSKTLVSLSDEEIKLYPGEYYVIAASPEIRQYYPHPFSMIVPEAFPVLNNFGDSLIIVDAGNEIIDRVGYLSSWGGGDGISLERISATAPSSISDNWAASTDTLGATPGMRNSVTPRDYDLYLEKISADITAGDSSLSKINLTVRIINQGFCPIDIATISVAADSEPILYREINCKDTVNTLTFQPMVNLSSGIHVISAVIFSQKDQNPENNSNHTELIIPFPLNSFQFNELMIHPSTSFFWSSEWVEIVNNHENGIDINRWRIGDLKGTSKEIVFPGVIPKNEFCVIAGDSSIFYFPGIKQNQIAIVENFPSLDNNNDRVCLFDPAGKVIDSLDYTSDWDIPAGSSLEKISPKLTSSDKRNWLPCTISNGATPTHQNSYTPETLEEGIVISPNPFSPDGDGKDDLLFIRFHFPFTPLVETEIYNITGRKIRRLSSGEAFPDDGVITWDGKSDDGDISRMGIYLIKLRVKEYQSGRKHEFLKTAVLVR